MVGTAAEAIVCSSAGALATITRVTNGQARPKPPPCRTAQATISAIEPSGTVQAKPAAPVAIIAAPPAMMTGSHLGAALATRIESTDHEMDSAAMM